MHSEHIPSEAKRGVIVTIPKSGKKQLNRLNSYRGITLLPSIYKLFETVVLNRIKKAAHMYDLNLCHHLQNAYQSGLCSLMTSFVLKETINYYAERGSKTFCCMLDASSAFDTVWHDGLFFKVYNAGINGRLWRVLRSAYTSVKSCVFVDGCISPWFNVRQSVRQGGVLSAWLYVIFMNQLPELLESNRIGAFIGDKFYGCPMQADDVALLALTKAELDKMMDMSYRYSCTWRYTLNPSKTVVLVFGETLSRHKRLSSKRKWKLGNDSVCEKTEHKHVGIILSTTMKNTELISTSCQKMRSSFFSLIGSGLRPSTTSPLTLSKLFKTVCIPRALFGCELNSNLSQSELNMLEVTYRFCVKYMQNFNKRTKTYICLASLGITNIECIIDSRKLCFLRRLCVAPLHTSAKNLFLNRLVCFNTNVSTINVGFVQDIMRLIDKYSLSFFIEQFISDGYFVPKRIWKHIVHQNVSRYYNDHWNMCVHNDICYDRFISIHNTCAQPLLLWRAASRFPNKTLELTMLARLCVTTRIIQTCELCNMNCDDIVTHLFCVCDKLRDKREQFWDFISRNYDIGLEIELFNKADEEFVQCLLGGYIEFFARRFNDHLHFIKCCACIWRVNINITNSCKN